MVSNGKSSTLDKTIFSGKSPLYSFLFHWTMLYSFGLRLKFYSPSLCNVRTLFVDEAHEKMLREKKPMCTILRTKSAWIQQRSHEMLFRKIFSQIPITRVPHDSAGRFFMPQYTYIQIRCVILMPMKRCASKEKLVSKECNHFSCLGVCNAMPHDAYAVAHILSVVSSLEIVGYESGT